MAVGTCKFYGLTLTGGGRCTADVAPATSSYNSPSSSTLQNQQQKLSDSQIVTNIVKALPHVKYALGMLPIKTRGKRYPI